MVFIIVVLVIYAILVTFNKIITRRQLLNRIDDAISFYRDELGIIIIEHNKLVEESMSAEALYRATEEIVMNGSVGPTNPTQLSSLEANKLSKKTKKLPSKTAKAVKNAGGKTPRRGKSGR